MLILRRTFVNISQSSLIHSEIIAVTCQCQSDPISSNTMCRHLMDICTMSSRWQAAIKSFLSQMDNILANPIIYKAIKYVADEIAFYVFILECPVQTCTVFELTVRPSVCLSLCKLSRPAAIEMLILMPIYDWLSFNQRGQCSPNQSWIWERVADY